jgi:hypothetical protein
VTSSIGKSFESRTLQRCSHGVALAARGDMVDSTPQKIVFLVTICLTLGLAVTPQSEAEKQHAPNGRETSKQPTVLLKADRTVGLAPVVITLTVDLVGGADDDPDFYCPTVEWDWGDDTQSESSFACRPYEPHVSRIVRHFAMAHIFDEGRYSVTFRLMRGQKALASAETTLVIE